jgi:hypothetical protein
MTRREFDRANKENWGGPGMATDEREFYRAKRFLFSPPQHREHDYIALRAQSMRRRNRLQGDTLATLDQATIFRAWAVARRDRGADLLGASVLFQS